MNWVSSYYQNFQYDDFIMALIWHSAVLSCFHFTCFFSIMFATQHLRSPELTVARKNNGKMQKKIDFLLLYSPWKKAMSKEMNVFVIFFSKWKTQHKQNSGSKQNELIGQMLCAHYEVVIFHCSFHCFCFIYYEIRWQSTSWVCWFTLCLVLFVSGFYSHKLRNWLLLLRVDKDVGHFTNLKLSLNSKAFAKMAYFFVSMKLVKFPNSWIYTDFEVFHIYDFIYSYLMNCNVQFSVAFDYFYRML